MLRITSGGRAPWTPGCSLSGIATSMSGPTQWCCSQLSAAMRSCAADVMLSRCCRAVGHRTDCLNHCGLLCCMPYRVLYTVPAAALSAAHFSAHILLAALSFSTAVCTIRSQSATLAWLPSGLKPVDSSPPPRGGCGGGLCLGLVPVSGDGGHAANGVHVGETRHAWQTPHGTIPRALSASPTVSVPLAVCVSWVAADSCCEWHQWVDFR